jgi:hypothetical protein
MADEIDYGKVLELGEDDLLLQFGLYLMGADERSLRSEAEREGSRQRARNWVARHWADLQQAARANPVVQMLRDDNMLYLTWLAGHIAEDYVAEPGAVYVAAVIVKLGLDILLNRDTPPWA